MSIPNSNKITHNYIDGKIFIQGKSIIAWLKEDLLYLLQHEDDEVLSSEYLQDRIKLFESNFGDWEAKHTEEMEKAEESR